MAASNVKSLGGRELLSVLGESETPPGEDAPKRTSWVRRTGGRRRDEVPTFEAYEADQLERGRR